MLYVQTSAEGPRRRGVDNQRLTTLPRTSGHKDPTSPITTASDVTGEHFCGAPTLAIPKWA
ncbi:MAG: hypothetical protein RL119_1237 [Actinomycetota bacterium]